MRQWHKNTLIFSSISSAKLHNDSQKFKLLELNRREANFPLIDLKIGSKIVDVGVELRGNPVVEIGINALV